MFYLVLIYSICPIQARACAFWIVWIGRGKKISKKDPDFGVIRLFTCCMGRNEQVPPVRIYTITQYCGLRNFRSYRDGVTAMDLEKFAGSVRAQLRPALVIFLLITLVTGSDLPVGYYRRRPGSLSGTGQRKCHIARQYSRGIGTDRAVVLISPLFLGKTFGRRPPLPYDPEPSHRVEPRPHESCPVRSNPVPYFCSPCCRSDKYCPHTGWTLSHHRAAVLIPISARRLRTTRQEGLHGNETCPDRTWMHSSQGQPRPPLLGIFRGSRRSTCSG